MLLTKRSAWQKIQQHQATLPALNVLLAEEHILDNWSLEAAGIFLDYSRQAIDQQGLALLASLADQVKLGDAIDRLASGAVVNSSESGAATHMLLRDMNSEMVKRSLLSIENQIRDLETAGIEHVVHVGLGGSLLGPQFVLDALTKTNQVIKSVSFLSSETAAEAEAHLATLDIAKTAFIIASKSFTTHEVLEHATEIKTRLAKQGGQAAIDRQLIAVTAEKNAALAWGIHADRVLSMDNSVGGRFSVWSAVGFVLAWALGVDQFREFLRGALSMDRHFSETSNWLHNIPVLLALLGVWYRNAWSFNSQAVISYGQVFATLLPYLQQLHMESLGKSCSQSGELLDYPTSPILWGGLAPDSQHSFHQCLYQGQVNVPIDFIASPKMPVYLQQCLAQASALAHGQGERTDDFPMQQRLTNRCPSSILLLDCVNIERLGALLALYEHKVFVQSVLWDINAFDQWGVEYGKRLYRCPDEQDSAARALYDKMIKREHHGIS